jgi:hypothetical protein
MENEIAGQLHVDTENLESVGTKSDLDAGE